MTRYAIRTILLVMSLLVAMTAVASPAFADLDAGAGAIIKPIEVTEGDGDSTDDGATYTEDTDTNDGTANNVSDDGDNAHPSGNDRSVESGGSGNQGSSTSNPDDSKGPQRYEGAKGEDKPNGPGGTDLADQDGNNGCGNDDDFNDDNNGHCGKTSSPDNSCSAHGHSGWECSENQTAAGSSSRCPNGKMGGDDTGHGANQGSAYDSTCDGSPSGNGNGTGGTKPCAGCVGNADDKNPPGQMPGGSDHNNGYECDGNSGVGRTNPAHTGCTDVQAATVDQEVQAAAVERRTDAAATTLCPAGTDNAGRPMAEADCNEDDSVLGKVLQKAGPLGAAVKGVGAAVGAVLPFTGNGDLIAFLAIALGLIAAGLLLLKRKKSV